LQQKPSHNLNPDKPQQKMFHAKAQSRKENLQTIRDPKNAILYQRNPKIDEQSQPLVSQSKIRQ